MTSVKIHQQLILQKGAAKGKKGKKREGGNKQAGTGACRFSLLLLCVCAYNLPLIWQVGSPIPIPGHSSLFTSRIQTLPLHCATWAEPLSTPSTLQGPWSISVEASHRTHEYDVCSWHSFFSFTCIASEMNAGPDVAAVINICRREKGREEEREGGRERAREERKRGERERNPSPSFFSRQC